MRFIDSERAASEVIGHVIILGITITGVAMILLVGMPTIYHMQEMINLRNAEQTFTVLDSRASKVALGESIQQLTNINLGGGTVAVAPNTSDDLSYMLFEMKGASGTVISIPVSMGKIIYRIGEREIGYEGGGVWSKYPEGSVMLSPPEFNFNGVTITLPILTITGNSSTSGTGAASMRIEKTMDPVSLYPNSSKSDYVNPISVNVSETIITIKSEYYDAWGEYFRSITLADVVENPANETVIVTLHSPDVISNFSYGALASDTITLGNNAETDSYNSSKGKYSISKSNNGSVRATNMISFPTSSATVNGSAMTGGVMTGKGKIKRDAYAKPPIPSGISVSGIKYNAVSGFSLGNTANLVTGKLNEYYENNDNNHSSAGDCLDGTGNMTLDSSDWGANSCEMSTGNYYLTAFHLDNNDILRLDTNSGAINIGVTAPITLNTQANITVIGNNPARFYLKENLFLGNKIEINQATSNDTSSLFQVISSSPQNIVFGTQSYFCGFIWAPDAFIDNGNNADIKGAIVGRKFNIGTGPYTHFDEALQSTPNTWGEGTKLVYLFMTRYDATVSVN